MRRPCRAALLLLVLACALPAPAAAQDAPAHINLGTAYRIDDPAGDVAVSADPLVSQVVTPPAFSDVDLRTVHVYEDFGPAGDQPSDLDLLVTTAGAIQDAAAFQVSFNITRGPTSLPTSTASGRGFNFSATPTAVGSSSARVTVPRAVLGAVGGDLLTNLTVTATRFDGGDLPVPQDDSTGTDQAPDAGTTAPPFTFFRPASASLFDVQVSAIAGTSGKAADFPAGTTDADVTLTITNLGLDAEGYSLTVAADPPLDDPPVFTLELRILPGGGSETRTVPISLQGVQSTRLTFTVRGERGGMASDQATLSVAAVVPPAAQRGVVPAGLGFLTPAAESLGLDGPFGKYAELALLALLVLLAILALYLLLALAPSTLKGSAVPDAPPLPARAPRDAGDAAAAPATVADAAASTGARRGGPASTGGPPPATPPPAPIPPAPVASLSILSVTHDPDAPEEGEDVHTEVVLRNGSATRQVRVVLALDGTDIDEAAATLPAFATKSVRLAWTAGPGENRVKVRVLPT